MQRLKVSALGVACFLSLVPVLAWGNTPGTSPGTALENCKALQTAGVNTSGTYWIRPGSSQPRLVYCDMETNGGGWTLLYNSVLGINTTDFWYILYWDRLERRGRPGLDNLFYDGSLYPRGTAYMDVIEDLRGKTVVAMVAEVNGIDLYSMKFISPRYVSGHAGIYSSQFAAGWAAPDFDGDQWPGGSCPSSYLNVTQHYSGCWVYNLGADADTTVEDGRVGPHLHSPAAESMKLSTDGSGYTRVRRISRFVKW